MKRMNPPPLLAGTALVFPALLAFLLGGLATPPACAAPTGVSLGVNFGAGLNNGGNSTTVTGSAGLLGAANWNNATNASGTGVGLVYDNAGANNTASAKLTWSSNGSTPQTTGTDTNDDQKLMNSFLDSAFNTLGAANRPSITVSNLDSVFTSGGYSVIVYINNQSGSIRGGQYTISDSSGYTNRCNTAITVSPFSGAYVQDTTQGNLDVSGETYGANYVLFNNLTGSRFTITTVGINMAGLSNLKTPVAGIEIVAAGGKPIAGAPVLSASSAYAGTPVDANVNAWGAAPLAYQWQASFNGGAFTNVSAANTNSLTVNSDPNNPAGNYTYRIIVTNGLGSVTSAPSAVLTVSAAAAPFLTAETVPEVVMAYAGSTAKFIAGFDGTQPIAYQWKFSTNQTSYSNVLNATNATLTLTNLQLSHAGYYSLWASNIVTGGYTVGSGDGQLIVLPGPMPAQFVVSNSAGVTVTVTSSGSYTIAASLPAWTLSGSVGQSPFNLASVTGTDSLGGYAEIRFGYTSNTSHAAAIRLYTNQATILFSDQCLGAGANDLAFPRLLPSDLTLKHIGYGGIFANYTFGTPDSDSPRIYFDTNFNTFILSSATNHMIATSAANADGSLSCGINSGIAQLPSGFTHRSILVIGQGINRTFETWGAALTGLSGKQRPANDASIELNKLGYWTDNGATYYYSYSAPLGYEGTLLAVRDEFAGKGVPLAYLQLDSWWYRKGVANDWQGDAFNNRGGVNLYEADPTLFPAGLASFQQQLGLPLVTHCRWIDPASPYTTQYAMSKNVVVDPAYWTNRMSYLKNAGVITYEQDWLDNLALPLMNLNDPPNFMNYMAAAAASNGLTMQYCLQLPRHFLQSSVYDHLTTLRTCQDRFEKGKWNPHLYASRFAAAVGAWPWTDVYPSTEIRNLLLGTLSAGMVGVGDSLGNVNATNLSKAVRPDSVIVKPDVPLMPLDQTYVNDALGLNLPMVAAAYVDHGNLRAAYVFAYARSASNTNASFKPSELGFSGNTYVFDAFNQTGAVVQASSPFNFFTSLPFNSSGGSFYIVVPVGPSGIAFLGDTNKFVTLGKKRISNFADSGSLSITVAFAPGETNVLLTGYAPSSPYFFLGGSNQAVAYNPTTQIFSVSVAPSESGTAVLEGSLTPLATSPKILKVYLQAGQSNSDGRGLTNGLPASLLAAQGDVPLYYYLTGGAANPDGTLGTLTTLRPGISALGGGTTFGPELTFGRAVADYYAVSNGVSTNTVMVAIIKYAHGGTSLTTHWAANGNSTTNGEGTDYRYFQRVVSAGLSNLAAAYPAANIELYGMTWVQGESDIDAGTGASAAYGTNLARFINDVRLTFATNQPYGTNLPFFLTRISDNQTVYSSPADPDYPNYLLLRAGQMFAATNLSNVFMLDTDGAQFTTATPWSSPGLHFDTGGQQALGKAFGQAVHDALPRPQLQLPVKVGNNWRLSFTGVTATTHTLERAPAVIGPWTPLTNIVIGAFGVTNYDDAIPPAAAAFYRVRRP